MKLELLKKLILNYLEPDDSVDIQNTDISDLTSNDTFSEYLLNMDSSIYNAIARIVTAKVLPPKTFEFSYKELNNQKIYDIPKKDIYEIDKISLIDVRGIHNVGYSVFANKIYLEEPKKNGTYIVTYSPNVDYFTSYLNDEITDINDIDLNDLGIPDNIAIIIKFYVYADLKTEENASLANVNRNYFEEAIASITRNDSYTIQTKVEASYGC